MDTPTEPAAALDTLEQVAAAGYCTLDWARWQQGQCGTYALALIAAHPHLRLGVLGQSFGPDHDGGWHLSHFFAHDDQFAYDSAGRHPLPYHGIHGDQDVVELDADPAAWAIPDEEGTDAADLAEATAHAAATGIVTGRHGLRPPA